MDYDTNFLTELKEKARRRAVPRSTNESMTPQIKMIVSNWYADELGNKARIIKARE
jgi:hypothetical protein